ncbi:septal ring lytic transglycosylase RlpA family protein [Phyllobacterium sp. YR531]|uniref:septal ring lytic transglycosylase RlpA family protein n=1 Tax=Phyllobacterium sp. YR531 TaxID=1144343 RepID=UPI00244E0FD2|nr:septal ring lytic transglycosylase RlpA family protein [Phyllobacterium sp. YR531]
MPKAKAFRIATVTRIAGVVAMGILMAACASPKAKTAKKSHGKEYFAESKYGVKASPRVWTGGKIKRGGGRDQVGRPYQVAGKWYYPKEEPGYIRKGRASWYGSAFHGRLTANGEVYDTAQLSAAHPTMPLPSYARVTNLGNGSSVIVRVNDRGPYHSDRVIDLSQRAATMLDYQHTGTADVKVEYVGRAPLNGDDDRFLMASYRGPGAADPWGQPASGVMIAMNGATPTGRKQTPVPGMVRPEPAGIQVASLGTQPMSLGDQANQLALPQQQQNFVDETGLSFNSDIDPILPLIGPFVADKPAVLIGSYKGRKGTASPFVNSYASERVAMAHAPVAATEMLLSPETVTTAWKSISASQASFEGEYVDIGLFASKEEAARLMSTLAPFGKVKLSEVASPTGARIALVAKADNAKETDALLQAAWKAGADDAFVVRDDGH